MPDQDPARFDIAAQVVFRLGEELITDVVQALVELVKNSYDADATWARVTIRTPDPEADEGTPAAQGCIEVEDDGHGMTEQEIRNGWLMIAKSAKGAAKRAGKTTERGRTPVGDKGLGRLGVQRLGHEVSIVTRTKGDADEITLDFSWRDFASAGRLSEVPVALHTRARSKRRAGTSIVVRDLKEPDQWRGQAARLGLQKKLSELLSPFREVGDFAVSVHIDGEELQVAKLAAEVREAAAIRYVFDFDGSTLVVRGQVQLDFLARANKREDKQQLQALMRRDQGAAYFDYLQTRQQSSRPNNLEHHPDSAWTFTFSESHQLAELDGVQTSGGEVASPGPFRGEIDYILLDASEHPAHIWDSRAEFSKYVKELSGIRVYRDGFGVRVGEDWLQLGKQQTEGTSQYALRPKNVVGYVAISARDNQVLKETTNREGFQQTPHFLNFYELLQRVVSLSTRAQTYLRRASLAYLAFERERSAGVSEASNEDIQGRLRGRVRQTDRKSKKLHSANQKLQGAIDRAHEKATEIADDPQFAIYNGEKLEQLNALLADLQGILRAVQHELADLATEEADISTAEELFAVLDERHRRTVEEVELFYEGVALGLTAEALSHEIASIAHRLSKRASTMAAYLAAKKPGDPKVNGFVEHVKSSIAALRRQLAHLDPSLRYVREQRVRIPVADELSEVRDFYGERLAANKIHLRVHVKDDFVVRLNQGKFHQVFDNLILNSEYWLKELRRRLGDNASEQTIHVEIARPVVRVWDDGEGVPLAVENTLFDPFVTTKQRGRGRGLGLFIIRQLLAAESCGVVLLLDRNEYGRRYKFEIDFGGALDG